MFNFRNIDIWGVKLHEILYCTMFACTGCEITFLFFCFFAVHLLPGNPNIRRLTLNCFRAFSFAITEFRVTIVTPYALSNEETPLNICFITGIMCFRFNYYKY